MTNHQPILWLSPELGIVLLEDVTVSVRLRVMEDMGPPGPPREASKSKDAGANKPPRQVPEEVK